MTQLPMVLALLLAASTLPAHAGEEEVEVNFQTGRRTMGADPLLLPQWSAEDREAFATGHPVNLGGGLWSEELYPLDPVEIEPSRSEGSAPELAATREAEFVRAVDLGALAKGPLTIASAASPEAAEWLRSPPRRAPRWPWLLVPLLALGVPAAWGTRQRRLRPRVFDFQDTETPSRLGGPHSAGSGAVLRW